MQTATSSFHNGGADPNTAMKTGTQEGRLIAKALDALSIRGRWPEAKVKGVNFFS